MLPLLLRNVVRTAFISRILLQRNIEHQAKRIALGVGLFVASGVVALVGIIAALASIFFALANMDTVTYPALITSGISFLIALFLALQGKMAFTRK